MPRARSSSSDWWQRVNIWLSENREAFTWLALWVLTCLLIIFSAGLFIASRSRTLVVLQNDSPVDIHDVTVRPTAVSSREPKHFLPHLVSGQAQTFVVYPLGPCDVVVDYLDSEGKRHHWEGARIAPRRSRTVLHLRAVDDLRVE